MTDVAALSLAVDASSVVTADEALQNLQQTAGQSPERLGRFKTATDELVAALNRNTLATDQLTTKLQTVQSASDRAADSVTKVGQASRTATGNVVDFAAAAAKARGEVDATTAAADKMVAAWAKLGAAGAAVSKNLTPQGMAEFRLSNLSSSGMGSNVGGQSPQQQQQQQQSSQSSAAQRDQILNYILLQGKDAFEQVLAGGSIGRALAIQAPQVVSLAAMGGMGAGDVISGIGGKLTGLAEGAVNVASRFGLLGTGLGAFGAALAVAVVAQQSYSSSQTQLARQLASGGGQRSGATQDQLNAIASGPGSGTTGSRREYAGQLAAAGVDSFSIGGVVNSIKDYAATTGQDKDSAVAGLAQAFSDPAKGAEMLNKQLGFLNASTLETIQRLQAQGDRLGATKVLLDAYNGSLIKASELTSGWAQVSESVLSPVANLWDKIGEKTNKFLTGGSLDEQIKLAQNVLDNSKGRQNFFGFGQGDVDVAQKQLDDLLKKRAQINQRSQVGQQNQASLALDATLKSLNPSTEALKRLEDQATAIRRPFMENWVDPNGAASAALRGLATQTAQMKADMAAGGAQYADMLRGAKFNQGNVGSSSEAVNVANINKQQDDARLAAFRDAAKDTDTGKLDKALATIEQTRDVMLQTARMQANIATSNNSGSYAIGLAQVPEQYRKQVYDSAISQRLSPDYLASLLNRESSFNANAVSPAGAQGIAQFMPKTAAGMGLSNPFDPMASIQKSAELLRQLLDSNGNNEAAALVGYNAGPKTMRRFQAAGNDPSVLKQETRDYIPAILTPSPSAKAALDAQVQRDRELDVEKQKLEAVRNASGENSAQYRAQVEKIEQLSAAQARNQVVSAAGIKLIEDEARKRQDLQMASQYQTMLANDNFARSQLGRSQDDQAVASAARPYQGTEYYDQVVQRTRDTQDMTQTKQMVMDGTTTFVSALRRGASASEALSQAFGNAADKLISKALDSIISGGFGMLQGGGSGGGFGVGLSDIGSWLGGGKSFIGFSSGGYTGDGGRYDPAGLVHRGEVVFSQSDVARFGGAGVVERMRLGFPGYADGGIVGGGGPAGMGPGGSQTNIQVNMQGSSGDATKDQDHVDNTVKQLRAEMESVYKQQEARSLTTNGTLWKAGLRRSAAG